jgi:hypothetical protein
MGKLGDIYKNKISIIVAEAMQTYINSEHLNPDENSFRRWLNTKKGYYQNRITNEIIAKYKPVNKAQAVGYIGIEIYKIMERDYESRTTQ